MRVTTDPTDADFGYGYRVMLDGIERSRVIEASEEGRYIVIQQADQQGRLVIDRASQTVKTERLTGAVFIEKLRKGSNPLPSAEKPPAPPNPPKKGWW